jgi:hypothetical protein
MLRLRLMLRLGVRLGLRLGLREDEPRQLDAHW